MNTGENYDDLFDDEEPAPRQQTSSSYVPPAPQVNLGEQFNQYFVKAYKQGEKAFCEDFRDINKAASRASFLHFREDWGTRLIAVNTQAGTSAELRWAGKDVGYAIYNQPE